MNDGSGGDFMDLSPTAIRRDLQGSLARMGIARVDLLQLHDPDPAVPIEESFGEVQRLVEEGLVRHGGLSNHPVSLIRRARSAGPVVSVQHRYNLLVRDIEREVLPFCKAENIGVLSWSSLAEGLLADSFDREQLEPGDFRGAVANFKDPLFGRVRELVASVAQVAAESGHTATDLAIAWLLSQEGMTGAIVGARSPKEVGAMSAAAKWVLRDDVLPRVGQAVAEFGLAGGA
jgi:aryl-alcohol dehydrogenase-like predicted oxidoreductase